jgi:hypothetical protein
MFPALCGIMSARDSARYTYRASGFAVALRQFFAQVSNVVPLSGIGTDNKLGNASHPMISLPSSGWRIGSERATGCSPRLRLFSLIDYLAAKLGAMAGN